MGGTGSGRYGGRATVEGCIKLSATALLGVRKGATAWAGSVSFPVRGGHIDGMIEFDAEIGEAEGSVILAHAAWGPTRQSVIERQYRVELRAVPQPFGGVRWWWVCPVRGTLCAFLHLPPGGSLLASRKAHRLAYAVQRMSAMERGITRLRRKRLRLGGCNNVLAPLPDKPKWMRWRTYDLKLAAMGALWTAVHASAEREALAVFRC